jgi:hypothetical protein
MSGFVVKPAIANRLVKFWMLLLGGLLAVQSSPAAVAAKPILVHYMPWFVAKPYSGSWGWHWTMNHFNPDTTNSLGQRLIASKYYPLIGPYDSADPVVLEYHVALMKLGGVDGVIADWYGQDNHLDYGTINQRTLALLTYTRKAGLKFSLCYEDRTVQQEVNDGYISSSNAVAHAQLTMLYAQTNYFLSTNYLVWNAKPVLLNFGPQYFSLNSQWQQIFSVLTNPPAFFTEDNRLPIGSGAFNWPPMWMSQTNNGVVALSALESYLSNFQQTGASWPTYISSAFPRFNDIYQQAGLGFTYGTLADNDGETFRSTLRRALTNNCSSVQIVTWNDHGEGTVVEPTVEFGYRDLGIIQDLRRQYVDANFGRHTNDLTLATRLYNLRRKHAGNGLANAELDRVFANIISGDLISARVQMDGMEAGLPVLYKIALNNGVLSFSIGGGISAGVREVQIATNLAAPDWVTINSFSASVNEAVFSTAVSNQVTQTFFRVRTQGQ